MNSQAAFRILVLVALAALLWMVLTAELPPRPEGASDVAEPPPASAVAKAVMAPPDDYIWIDRERLQRLPVEGPAWEQLKGVAEDPLMPPDLSDQDDPVNVQVLAKALVHARTGDASLRETVVMACMMAIGTERGGRTLSLGKELIAYVLAADLVGLPSAEDARFRAWLRELLGRPFPSGKTLRSTHEDRPNNWGTYAGASRLAAAAYLGDGEELARAARVFKGWLGDRDSYAGFSFKSRDWQANPESPVGINPAGSRRRGFSIDGVLPDDQRRGGGFRWPPPRENYVYSALQGAVAQAVILSRAGYPVWEWEGRALLRAFRWLHEEADFPAVGDDTWQPHVVNYYYGTNFPAPVPAEPGKNVGWTDWTHGPVAQRPQAPREGDDRRSPAADEGTPEAEPQS